MKRNSQRKIERLMMALLATTALGLATSDARADDFSEYATKTSFTLTPPPRTAGYFTLYGTFSESTTAVLDGYELKGRLFAVDGDTVWLQKNFGSSVWVKIATVDVGMDPAFFGISPDGTKFALGTGYYKPLYVGATSTFSVESPPNLSTVSGVKRFEATYYDGV